MVLGLLTVFGSYGICILLAHFIYGRVGLKSKNEKHYVIVTKNNESSVEWVLRSLLMFMWWTGRSMRIHVLDECSQDDTVEIVKRLSMRCVLDVQMQQTPQTADEFIRSLDGNGIVVVRLYSGDRSRTLLQL